MTPSWDDLKVALAVHRAGSLTRAAEVLGIDQSTCGRRLAALEAALGAVLFLRSRSGLVATEQGEAAIRRAIEVELRMDRLAEDVAGAAEGAVGTVRLVGSAWTLARLASFAPALLAENPRLDLRLVATSTRTPVRPEATLSLWFETPTREPEFAIKLVETPYALYARRGAAPDALPWVTTHDEEALRIAPARALSRLRRRGEPVRVAANDAGALAAAIAAGIGKGLLPMALASERADLVRLAPETPPELVRTLHLHMHPDTVQSRRVQAVVGWLRGVAGAAFGAGGEETGR